MDSFGEYLRRERELRGVTLEEIAKASNISKIYLKALEADDFETLPEEVFVKGFLKTYAENTGMDPNEVILAYNSFIAKRRTAQTDLQEPLDTSPKLNIKLSSFLAIVVFVVVSSLMVFYYVKKSGEIKSSSISEEKISPEIDEPGAEESESTIDVLPGSETTEPGTSDEEGLMQTEAVEAPAREQESSDNLIPSSTLDNTAPSPPVEREEIAEIEKVPKILTLSMKATEGAWISLVIDGTENKEAILRPGETARWEAKEKFVVGLGNAAGTSLRLNGKKITLPKAPRNVVKDFTITLDNIN